MAIFGKHRHVIWKQLTRPTSGQAILMIAALWPVTVVAQSSIPESAPTDQSRIIFTAEQFSSAKSARQVASTAMADWEIMSYSTGRYIAQFQYWRNRPGWNIVLGGGSFSREGMSAAQKAWPFFRGKRLIHIDGGSADTNVGPIKYERFSIGIDAQCFYFDELLEPLAGKRNHGLMGYICKSGSEGLSHAKITELLSGIYLRGIGHSPPSQGDIQRKLEPERPG